MNAAPLRALAVTSYPDRPEAETFIGLHRLGVELCVCLAADAIHFDRLAAAGVPVEPLSFSGRVDRNAIETIRSLLHSRRFDILHLFNNRAVVNGLIAARGSAVRIIAYRGIVGNEGFANPFSWMRYLNPRVDTIVCVAEAVRQSFLKMGMPGIRMRRDKPVTIYKGHSLDWYRAPPANRAGLGIPEDAFVAGCVANWRPRKGVDVLLEAFERLPPEAPIHLLLAGNMDHDRLRSTIEASAHRERIHVLGFREDAPAVIAACDVAVLPSVKREGLAKTVIEAMAYGVAPIVTDCGGSPELVENGKSGIVVPVRDAAAIARAIELLYSDPALRLRLGAAARERIGSKFTIEQTIEQTYSLYQKKMR
jgi:glycosyltransferase involved in cell wall biosynthesis